jgi:hypothetical protein
VKSHRAIFAEWWAILVIAVTFLEAIHRLGARAFVHLAPGLSPGNWVAFAGLLAVFGYGEGWRALHCRFVPGVLARATAWTPELAGSRGAVWLSPLRALGLVGASRRDRVYAWSAVAGIVAAVLAVRSLPDPWRAMIDGAVAFALAIGLGSLLVGFLARHTRGKVRPSS